MLEVIIVQLPLPIESYVQNEQACKAMPNPPKPRRRLSFSQSLCTFVLTNHSIVILFLLLARVLNGVFASSCATAGMQSIEVIKNTNEVLDHIVFPLDFQKKITMFATAL